MRWMTTLLDWLIPADTSFFDHVEAAAQAAVQAAGLLDTLLHCEDRDAQSSLLEAIHEAEHAGDRALKNLMDNLHRTFVTPIDREDLYHLTAAIEDVSDLISSTARHLATHQITRIPEGSHELAQVLLTATHEFNTAVGLLRSLDGKDRIRAHCQALHHLEHEADVIFRLRLGDLFGREKNAVVLIQHKEFLEGLENAVDQCAIVAGVLEAIVLRNG